MALAASALGVLTPLAQGPVAVATLMVFIPQLIGDGLKTIEHVAGISLRQAVVPDRVLGRVNATLGVTSHGIGYPIGALTAAFAAEQIGVRGAIAVGWAGMALSILWLVFSPLPRLRSASDYVPAESAAQADPTSSRRPNRLG
jgi:MFS family permease